MLYKLLQAETEGMTHQQADFSSPMHTGFLSLVFRRKVEMFVSLMDIGIR